MSTKAPDDAPVVVDHHDLVLDGPTTLRDRARSLPSTGFTGEERPIRMGSPTPHRPVRVLPVTRRDARLRSRRPEGGRWPPAEHLDSQPGGHACSRCAPSGRGTSGPSAPPGRLGAEHRPRTEVQVAHQDLAPARTPAHEDLVQLLGCAAVGACVVLQVRAHHGHHPAAPRRGRASRRGSPTSGAGARSCRAAPTTLPYRPSGERPGRRSGAAAAARPARRPGPEPCGPRTVDLLGATTSRPAAPAARMRGGGGPPPGGAVADVVMRRAPPLSAAAADDP